jgi:hypothetical protein
MEEDDDADRDGDNAGNQHRAGGDVERRAHSGSKVFIESAAHCFDGAVQEFASENETDAPQEYAPFEGIATEDDGGRDDQGREEEVNKKAGVATNTQFDAAESIAELGPPRPPPGKAGGGIGPTGTVRSGIEANHEYDPKATVTTICQ